MSNALPPEYILVDPCSITMLKIIRNHNVRDIIFNIKSIFFKVKNKINEIIKKIINCGKNIFK